ncbi:MAG: winged helix-turn-helix transcriptional regulator [Clostridia bacterium]|nr:winged helix-turn-helix transcriptional regulator [Clostridia bacterium]
MKERFRTFTVLITKISRCIRKIKTEEMDELNLKSPHVSSLYYLYKMGDMPAKELCDICKEDKAAMSRSISDLEMNGYLKCESTAKKRYNSALTLTEKGEEIGKYIADKIDSVLNLASEGLTEEKRAILYEGLELISNNLEKFCEKY